MTHYFDAYFQWADAPTQSITDMTRAAQQSVVLDDKNPLGQLMHRRDLYPCRRALVYWDGRCGDTLVKARA